MYNPVHSDVLVTDMITVTFVNHVQGIKNMHTNALLTNLWKSTVDPITCGFIIIILYYSKRAF